MADSKISALTALATAPAAGDLLVLVDVSDTTMAASGTDKKITFTNLTGTFLTSSTGLLATGATTGATSQAQTFTNGINGGAAANDDITINGTSHATKTSSYVLLQPSGGNVGIGVTPSSYRLDVNGTGRFTDRLLVQNSTASFEVSQMSVTNAVASNIGTFLNVGSSSSYPNYVGCSFDSTTFAGLGLVMRDNANQFMATRGQVRFHVANNVTKNLSYTSKNDAAQMFLFTADDDIWGTPPGSTFTIGGNTYTVKAAASDRITVTTSISSEAATGTLTGVLYAPRRMTWHTDGKVSVGSMTTATALLHVAASATTAASLCINVGTAPTTPVAGDIWNDGALSFYNADATTNAIVNHLRLRRNSTGTAAAGFGLGIIAELESSTTDAQSAGRLTWEWATATHASRAAKGKLTAYYTSTEREAITWVADSSSARVGIMNASPTAMLHVGAGADSPTISETIGYFSNAGTTAIAVRDSTNDAEAVMYISSSGAIYGTMTSHPVYLRTANNDVLSILANGNVGIGVTAPQGKLHGHDGSGGFLFVNQASVGGTLVTVIPDAAGDVTEKIFFVGWCTNSAPFSADVAPTTLAVSSSTTKTDGTNTLTIAVTAGGAFTLQATGGAATWNVNLWVFWR